ncbi:tetratricopeptide repeat protein 12 [Episyrphus balteatus]|uniref:tetratricopeptide repeat protein 12 n=1 Tax=Episyrphus balteatus TaxID=286459 RepID=UPI002485521C|nr:tetratricopeptide repeat protein 12 [Episyrphus balteatus]
MSKTITEDPDFKNFESKVNQVMQILENMNSGDPVMEAAAMKNADNFLDGKSKDFSDIDEDNFIVKVRENRTLINKSGGGGSDADTPNGQMDKFTFMQQIEQDAAKRNEVRQEREKIAQHFRKLGNDAYHKQEFEKAINMFTKAIDHVKDSPILYNNRALSYMKLKVHKRAIIDCDFVINKLDDKNLRAWLYRAAAYYKLGDEKNFETSIKWAKKNNSKELETIEKFVANVKNEQF